MTLKDIPWTRLDPTKADLGAVAGAYVAGCTLLELPSDPPLFTVTGVCSCASREGAEAMARRNIGPRDKDQFISRATLVSWFATKP